MSDTLFSTGYYFSQVFPCKLFPAWNQSAEYFFLKSPLTPSKVKWLAPKIHQKFAQLTDTDLSITSKAFWNNGGQDSLAMGEGRNLFLLTPAQRVHTDVVDVITKFSQMDSLPNFLSYGATPVRRLCYNLQCTMLHPVPLYFNFVLWVQDTMYNYELEVYFGIYWWSTAHMDRTWIFHQTCEILEIFLDACILCLNIHSCQSAQKC